MNAPQSEAHEALPSFWPTADDWTTLVGLNVEIHERGRVVDRGRVEATTADGRILWLAQEGPSTRRLWEAVPERYVRITTHAVIAGAADIDQKPRSQKPRNRHKY